MADNINRTGPAAPVQPVYTAVPPNYTQTGQSQGIPQPVQQPVVQQPVYVQPVYTQPPQSTTDPEQIRRVPEVSQSLVIYSHSNLFYWWPIWAVGYLMAVITWMAGHDFQVGNNQVRVHPSNNLGIFFVFTLVLVVLISNVTVRGLASALVIVAAALVLVLFAYFGLWDDIFGFVGSLTIYINQGAYFWIATSMLLIWLFAFFVFDRMTYWRVTNGQVTEVHIFGTSAKSFDTENMTFEKRRDDVFRHWLLGLGSGDLIVNAYSAGQREKLRISNVLFVAKKAHLIQEMIATEPEVNANG
jgi:hypothetical protein